MKSYDAIILGAGPAGLTAALYLARFGAKFALVEKMTPGGLLLQIFEIENYPGLIMPKGYELVDAMEEQLKEFTFDRYRICVTALEHKDGKVRLQAGEEALEAKTLIICAGLHYNKLGLPDEDKFTGRGVSYCALCDANFFKGRVVGLAGNGNQALEEAIHLAALVKELRLFMRTAAPLADRVLQKKLLALKNVVIHKEVAITALHGESELEAVSIRSLQSGETEKFAMSGLFVIEGMRPVSEFFPRELALDADGFIVTDTEMRTNLPGVFAAGDIRSKLCRQIVTAAGDGATAANAAYSYLELADA
jgi:thioredoxin reductase (NADPH)